VSLLDEARAATKRPGGQSRIYKLVGLLDGDERAEVIDLVWCAESDISARATAEVLNRHYEHLVGAITGNQVEDHRRSKVRPE
jgi:hypothetical protein